MDKRFGFAGSMMLAAMAFAGMLCPVIAVAADESSSIILAERGKAPDRAIVISATAGESQRYAAEELRDYVKQMTDVELPICTDEGELPAKAIFVGGTKWTDSIAGCADGLGTDGFRIVSRPPHVVVQGGVRGVLYGVYELLEKFGGVEWLASWRTVVPRRESFAVPVGHDETQRPAFSMRRASCNDPVLSARLRFNGRGAIPSGEAGMKFGGAAHASIGVGHSMKWLLPPKKYFAEHPEYFSETGGVRIAVKTQPCLTNPDVLRIVTSNVLQNIRRKPEREYVTVTQNDNFNYCACTNCAAVDAEEESHAGTLVRFVNAVAEAVEKEFPHVKVQTFAYQYTQKPPKKTRLRHNVMLTMCTITADFSEPLAGCVGAHNKKRNLEAHMRSWAEQASEMFVWDYTVDFNNFLLPFPNVYTLLPNLRFFRECGAKYIKEEGYRGPGEFAELKVWLLSKGMWNPDVEVKPLLDRFFAGFYGAAAPVVREYFERLQELPKKVGGIAETYTNGRRTRPVTNEFLAWATTNIWPKAEMLVRDDPACLHNVRLAEASTVYARIMRLKPEKDAAELESLLDWMEEIQRETGGKMRLRLGRHKDNQLLIMDRWNKIKE